MLFVRRVGSDCGYVRFGRIVSLPMDILHMPLKPVVGTHGLRTKRAGKCRHQLSSSRWMSQFMASICLVFQAVNDIQWVHNVSTNSLTSRHTRA